MEVINVRQPPLPQRILGRKARRTLNRNLANQSLALVPQQTQLVVRQPIMSARSAPSARRNRRRRNRRKIAANPSEMAVSLPVQYSPNAILQNPIAPQAPGVSTGRSNMIRSNYRVGSRLSKDGVNFLKCAFSAADFDGSGVYGVPDDFGGKTIAIKHRNVASINFTANTDVYILVLPVPGYSYFISTTTAGSIPTSTANWIGFAYSDYNGVFPSGGGVNTAANVTKFRFVSQHFEFVPTVNNNSWTGNIQSWKIPVQWTTEVSTSVGQPDRTTITGLNGTGAFNADSYTGPFNLGLYTGAFNKGSSAWDFSRVEQGISSIPSAAAQSEDFGSISWDGVHALPGFDNNFESIVIKISGMGSNTLNSAIIKTWACVEYQFSPGNLMYEMQNLHFQCDQEALNLYRYVVQNLPVGVSYLDNANFWARVLSIIRSVSGGLSVIPGPYGAIAGGVNAISTGLEALLV